MRPFAEQVRNAVAAQAIGMPAGALKQWRFLVRRRQREPARGRPRIERKLTVPEVLAFAVAVELTQRGGFFAVGDTVAYCVRNLPPTFKAILRGHEAAAVLLNFSEPQTGRTVKIDLSMIIDRVLPKLGICEIKTEPRQGSLGRLNV
jgi:hypothetical protein